MSVNFRWYRKHVLSFHAVDLIKFCDLSACSGMSSGEDVELSLLQAQDISELMEFHDTKCVEWNHAFTRNEVEDRLASGQICTCARYQGRIAGFIWFAPRRIYSPDLHCMFELDGSGVVIHNGFVDPARRGMKIGPMMMDRSFQMLYEMGYRTVYGYPRITNQASKKAMSYHGFVTFGKIFYGYVLGFYYFLPFHDPDPGMSIRRAVSPWHRWQTFFQKRLSAA